MTNYQYALGQSSDVRVWRGLAWREYTWDGEIICESEAKGIVPEFGHADDVAIANHIATLTPPKYGLNVFIRFGALPENGRSRNWATGTLEAGVSAYEAAYDLMNGHYQVYGALPGAEIAYRIKGETAYFLAGERIGTGSDGEALLANATVIAEAAPSPHGYR